MSSICACVADIIAAYHHGSALLQRIKTKRAAKQLAPPPCLLLEQSLQYAPTDIEYEKDRGIARLGQEFDVGDLFAIEALQRIKVELKAALWEQLVEALQRDEMVDFGAVVDAAEDERDRTITVLVQLRQRLLAAAQLASGCYNARGTSKRVAPPVREMPAHRDSLTRTLSRPLAPQSYFGTPPLAVSPREAPPSELPSPTQHSPSPPGLRRESSDPHQVPLAARRTKSNEKEYSPSYFPSFSFRRRKRDGSVSLSRQTTTSPLPVSEHSRSPSNAMVASPGSTSSPQSEQSSAMMQVLQGYTDDPAQMRTVYDGFEDSVHIWTSSDAAAVTPVQSSSFPFPRPAHPASSLHLPIPTEQNGYLGFCKGAWKLQNGSASALKTRREFNDGWSSSRVPFLACSSTGCAFAGRLPASTVHKVWRSSKGVAFRWRFLAKCHVPQMRVDREQYVYMCMFCALMGRGGGVYAGTDTLLVHLGEHRAETMPPEVLHRARCVVDRVAGEEEGFDVNLYPMSVATRARKESEVLPDSLLGEPWMWQPREDSILDDDAEWKRGHVTTTETTL